VEHALHMPSHIFVQTGLWPDLVASNERAWAASRANAAEEHLSPANLDFHSLAWLTYGYLEQGRFRAARATVDSADAVLRGVALPAHDPDPGYARSWQSFLYAMETDDWRAYRPSLREAMPDTSSMRALMMTLASAYQHAVAAAMLGDTSSASATWLRAYAATHADAARKSGVLHRGLLHLDALAARRRGDTVSELAILEHAAAADDSAGAPSGPPTILRSHELLGAALLRAGRPADAVRAYERALAQTPNRSAALLGLAHARAATGDTTAARDAYRALAANWNAGDADFPSLIEAKRHLSAGRRVRSP
jgi:tetratricopeptide (TPR) repeat protein